MRRQLVAPLALATTAAVAPACGSDPPAPPPTSGKHQCGETAFTNDGEVRVFAVQQKIDPKRLTSYETFRASIVDLVDACVKPALAKDRPNLVVFPEDASLPAYFIGSRAEDARQKTAIAQAFLDLLTKYVREQGYYEKAFPELGFGEKVGLTTTDTVWRAFYETMRDVAVQTGAWVVASANVPRVIDKSDNPADVSALADPDLKDPAYVYVAKDRRIYNTAFVFDPKGNVVFRARKPYLVESEEKDLQFTFGELADVTPFDTGFAKLAILTSKDAWMPDVVDRLAILGADVFVQPEAFSGWGIEEHPGDWLPDVVQQSGWAAVQKHGAYRYGVIPHLTGNLFDLVFDGQSAILSDAVSGSTRPAYVGQPRQAGFLAVAPWVAEGEDRASLRAVGEALKPGGARANEYVETVIAADLQPRAAFPFDAPAQPGALGASAPISDAPAGEQTWASVASDGASLALVAWEDTRDGAPRVYLARSTDGGRTFGAASPVAPGGGEQRTPAVHVGSANVVTIAWQDRASGQSRIVAARSTDGGATFGQPVVLDGAAPADEWLPAIAGEGQSVYVAYVSGRSGNERIRVARSNDGIAWSSVEADAGASKLPAPNIRNNQWAPAIAASASAVVVAWVDFRNYNWDVFAARSNNGGISFEAPSRVDDGTDDFERLNADPSVALLPDGTPLFAWSDVRKRKPGSSARTLREGKAGASLGPATHAWRPHLAVLDASNVVAVWQDHGSFGNDALLAKSSDGGATFGAPSRVDDGGPASQQFRPRVAAFGATRLVVVWEDTRSGRRRLRFASGG
jgi:predicted amidohydrolase